MQTNRPFFGSKEGSKIVLRVVRPLLNFLMLTTLILLIVAVISNIGYNDQSNFIIRFVIREYRVLFTLIGIIYFLRVGICIGFRSYSLDFITFSTLGLLIILTISFNIDKNVVWLNNFFYYALLVFLLLLFEVSRFDIKRLSLLLNPAQLLMISFATIILIGSALLMLPKATVIPISYVDALFTSTSAVCVTGLTTMDVATGFSLLGKSTILILCQIGGIGIMTFTFFFGYFFKGNTSSFSEKFVLSEFFSQDNVSDITKTLLKVVVMTIAIEAIGCIILFFSFDPHYFPSVDKRVHLAVFHSISAFCNAGFSTVEGGLFNIATRNSMLLLYTLSGLIILGGIGFPILLNMYTFFKIQLMHLITWLSWKSPTAITPQIINLNTRLVVVTTTLLLIIGTLFFYLLEQNNALAGLSFPLKLAHSFFGSVTPRTAGFNSLDYGGLTSATIAVTIFLMWVGGSPVSTGGGIKTSTFAVAMLNTIRIARMKNHIELHKREIHERSVDRSFAIVILSIVILGCSSLAMVIIEPHLGVRQILFECVSAFGNVGLSMNLTPLLSDASKLLLVGLMFAGRMGILTLLFAIFRSKNTSVYRFPKENIVIT